MIEVRHLCKAYGKNQVLQDVSTTIQDGEVISIIGPSGTGKSTFLRCLNLLERADSGQILVDGEDILAPNYDAAHLRRKMGMVFQSFNLFPHLNIRENLTLAPRYILGLSEEEANRQAMELLDKVGLASKANALVGELSGGQQQRVAIARALAMKPQILLLDEPTSALDPTMVNEVLAVVRALAKTGITMLFVTHEMRCAREIANRTLYMDEGGIYEDAPTRELFEHPQRPRTIAFFQRVKMLNFALNKDDFDLYNFRGKIEAFAEKQALTQRKARSLNLLLEELLFNFIFPVAQKFNLAIGISEDSKTTDIILECPNMEQNPLDSADERQELSLQIIRRLCADWQFQAGTLNLTLK